MMKTKTSIDLDQSIINFYNDPDFKKLKQYYERTTIFDILNIQRWEIRHSSFLCWLFNKDGSHNLGEKPLKNFIRLISKKINDSVKDIFIVGNYSIHDFEIVPEKSIYRDNVKPSQNDNQNGRIDIYIKFRIEELYNNVKADKIVQIIVENKVYSLEHDNQTDKYYKWAQTEIKDSIIIGVFLSPTDSNKTDNDAFINITYQDLLQFVIEPLQTEYMTDEVAMMLRDYIINLGKPAKMVNKDGTMCESAFDDIMATTEENGTLIKSIFDSHKDLLLRALIGEDNRLKVFLETNKLYIQLIFKEITEYENDWIDIVKEKAFYEGISRLYGKKGKRVIFIFNGQEIKGKNTLVLSVVKHYVAEHKNITVDELNAAFNKITLLRGGQVISLKTYAEQDAENNHGTGSNYFLKENDLVDIKGEKVAVWCYWPDRFFVPFKDMVEKDFGYKISEK